jgi:hypothetical protein
MVLVMAFVMEPAGGDAVQFLFIGIGGTVALEIADGRDEFLRTVLGKVVDQTLPIEAAAETVFPYQGTMMVDCGKMSPETFPE